MEPKNNPQTYARKMACPTFAEFESVEARASIIPGVSTNLTAGPVPGELVNCLTIVASSICVHMRIVRYVVTLN
jgi:hypothetical protein